MQFKFLGILAEGTCFLPKKIVKSYVVLLQNLFKRSRDTVAKNFIYIYERFINGM